MDILPYALVNGAPQTYTLMTSNARIRAIVEAAHGAAGMERIEDDTEVLLAAVESEAGAGVEETTSKNGEQREGAVIQRPWTS
jgi:hypothetical protein